MVLPPLELFSLRRGLPCCRAALSDLNTYFVEHFSLTLSPPAPTMQPESSDGFASVGTILPEERAALLPGGSFRSKHLFRRTFLLDTLSPRSYYAARKF